MTPEVPTAPAACVREPGTPGKGGQKHPAWSRLKGAGLRHTDHFPHWHPSPDLSTQPGLQPRPALSRALFLSFQGPSSCQTKTPAPACRPTGTWGLRAWESKPVLQRRPCVWRNTHPLLPNPSKSSHCSALRRRLLTRGQGRGWRGWTSDLRPGPPHHSGRTQGPSQGRSVSWHCAPSLPLPTWAPSPCFPTEAKTLPPAQTARWTERAVRTRTEVGLPGECQGARVRCHMKDALISQMAREARDEMALDLGAQLQLGDTGLHSTPSVMRPRPKHRPSDPKPGVVFFFFKKYFTCNFFSQSALFSLQLNFR